MGNNYDRLVAEPHLRIFIEGWLACLTNLGVPEDAWSMVAPTAELPESPKPYLPMILPDFNEEEFMN